MIGFLSFFSNDWFEPPSAFFAPYSFLWFTLNSDYTVTWGMGPIPGENVLYTSISYPGNYDYMFLTNNADGSMRTYYFY